MDYKPKYVYEILVNCLVKLAQKKSVARCTDHPDMTMAVDGYVKQQTKKDLTGNFAAMLRP